MHPPHDLNTARRDDRRCPIKSEETADAVIQEITVLSKGLTEITARVPSD